MYNKNFLLEKYYILIVSIWFIKVYIKLKKQGVNMKANVTENENNTTSDTNSSSANECEEFYSEAVLEEMKLSSSLYQNTEIIKKIVGNNADLVVRNFTIGRTDTVPGVIYYLDNLIDTKHIDSNILQPILVGAYSSGLTKGCEIVTEINLGNLITRAQVKKAKDMKVLLAGLVMGEVVLLMEGIDEAEIISAKGYDFRPVSESEVEPVVRGPRDSFNEVLSVNLGLIRRRIKSPNLVFESMKIGRVTETIACIAYIRGICSSKLVAEVRSRISRMDIDGILGANYIEEFINDEPYSLFPQIRNSERPDVTCAALLEGRVAIIVDNTPVVLILPAEMFSLLQSPEDYYNGFVFSSFVRVLRYIACFVALALPSFYIAIANFHQELIPTSLLISIISARIGVPLPNFLEAFLMECTFEILREAGVRLPRPMGQAVSIVGALVIGQSAVQASLVSPLMVIVVALTAIASFSIPQYNISHPIRILRFPLMILTSILGLYGLMLGLMFILIHLCSIRSFGIPYLNPIAPFKGSDLKDTIVRFPIWSFKRRPAETSHNKIRIPFIKTPKPPKDKR